VLADGAVCIRKSARIQTANVEVLTCH
jgi:hypothetical protein